MPFLANRQFDLAESKLEITFNEGITPRYFLLAESLPPAIVPINPGGVVNVPPVNRPEPLVPAMPPNTLLPTAIPTPQFPTISVPSLQTSPLQTPTPVTTSQPEGSSALGTSTPSSSPMIEFGQPLQRLKMR